MPKKPLKTIANCLDVFVNSHGIVNVGEVGSVKKPHGRTTAAVEMKIGERLLITRENDRLKVELYEAKDR
jgi:hypothetical protein